MTSILLELLPLSYCLNNPGFFNQTTLIISKYIYIYIYKPTIIKQEKKEEEEVK